MKLYGLQIKESNIDGIGYGLFAQKNFNRGDYICDYIGEFVNMEELDIRYGEDNTAPYAFEDDYGVIVDSACKRGIGSWINSHPIFNRNNAHFIQNGNRIVARATKQITPGEEIYIHYGNNYRFDEDGVQHYTRPYHPNPNL